MGTRIVRDVDGIAHVRAGDEAGAFRGQGYAAASDRLWQIEFDRRRAIGRLAEIVGPNAVSSDRYHLRLGLAQTARADVEALAPRTVAMLTAYARGVNEAIARTGDLPPEFRLLDAPRPGRWEPWHSIAVFKVRHLWMGTAELKLWRSALVALLGARAVARLWPQWTGPHVDPTASGVRTTDLVDLLGEAAGLVDELARLSGTGAGSNNLVVAGSRTASGRPLMAGDPHRALDLPNVYWQNHLTWPGGDVIGLSFPGVPGFPHFGHNQDVAWSITHGMADDQDLYVERLRRGEGTGVRDRVEALRDGSWEPVRRRVEYIPVAGGPDDRIECLETANGPVVAGGASDGVGLSLRWTATASTDTTFDCLLAQMTARSADELDAAFVPWVVPCNNVLVADRSGTIAYRFRGRLAIRPEANGWTVADGTDASTAWSGFVPDSSLSRVRDPVRGFLVTANNRVGDGPYVSNDWAHPARARRLTDLLDADGWTVASIGAALGDTYSAVARAFARRLARIEPTDELEAAALALVAEWDHRMDSTSAAALVYGATRAEVVRRLGTELGLAGITTVPGVGYSQVQRSRALHLRVGFVVEDPDVVSDALLGDAFRVAVASLGRSLGTDVSSWRWGRAHTAGFHHPLAALRPDLREALTRPAPVPLGGDNECVWASGTIPPSLESFTGPVARYVFDLADWDRSRWIVPHGVHGDPRSDHFTDQLERWATLELAPMRYSAQAVDDATAHASDLDPHGTT